MKKKLITFTDEQAKELESFPNQSEVVRNALDGYLEHITPEVLKGLRVAYDKINGRLGGIEQAVNKIALAAHVTIDKHSDWGA